MNSIAMETKKKSSASPITQRTRNPNSISRPASMVLNVSFILYCVLSLIPVLLVLSVSFSDENAIALHGYRLIPESFSLAAYQYLWQDAAHIAKGYSISIFVTLVGSLLGLTVTAMFAYPLSRMDFNFRGFFSFFIFFTMIFSGGLVPWYLVYTKLFPIKDTLFALIIPNHLMNAFFVIMVRTFFQTTIHPSLIESASIDGASEMKIFRSIVLPLSLPVLATVGLFYTIGYWNDWFNSLVFINNDNLVNLQYMMYKVMRNLQYLTANAQVSGSINISSEIAKLPNETVRMAMCITGMGPIVLAFPMFQKYFIKGLTVGAIKG
ncbi:carbohydrate ABC transporter permease [Paenibacillus qinlingensis]|uniref:carbohydrate ABC transporter permease n=1 Tax=Paenibacillus qinlingensis TaxID=1837343 RepID=UPI00236811B7|nr:carbohydrate ABC transporter permease [Paenibacillus qinlingensis]